MSPPGLTLSGTNESLKDRDCLKIVATAAFTDTPLTLSPKSDAELRALSPLSKSFALTLPDSTHIGGTTAIPILRALASLSPFSGLDGSSKHAENPRCDPSRVDAWLQFFINDLEIPARTAAVAKSRGVEASPLVEAALAAIDRHMTYRTYVVGNAVTLADIAGCCAVLRCEDAGTSLEGFEHVSRWFETVKGQEFFVKAMGGGKGCGGSQGVAPKVEPQLYKKGRARIVSLLKQPKIGAPAKVCGWARTVRKANKGQLLFVELNDGSCGTNLQCILEIGVPGFEEVMGAGGVGASFEFVGEIVDSPAAGQAVELKVTNAVTLGPVYGGDIQGDTIGGKLYPLSKKHHTLERMREIAHLRPRSRIHAAAMRIRHAMAFATHKFFNDLGFLYIHTPILTCADCEGAGEQFGVTTMLGNDPHDLDVEVPKHRAAIVDPDKKISKSEQKRMAKKAAKEAASADPTKPKEEKVVGAIDYNKDFFGRRANLTVSGQLNVETHACALSDVYTFGPTFRAENSHTGRHLSEFWMIEPEIAFADLQMDIDLAEDYLKYCVKYALEMCQEDLEFFENSPVGEAGLRDRLRNVIQEPFKRLTYTEAIEILSKTHTSGERKFEETPVWGMDLPSEMERYLCETVFKKPVVLTDYPKEIKAFYMKLNDDGKTVAAADVLVPKIGEIIGGSQREHRKEVLVQRCEEMGLDIKSVWWYLDLRKYGTVPHAGFGLGFERLILFVTGLDNIRDVIPFPRWAGNAEF